MACGQNAARDLLVVPERYIDCGAPLEHIEQAKDAQDACWQLRCVKAPYQRDDWCKLDLKDADDTPLHTFVNGVDTFLAMSLKAGDEVFLKGKWDAERVQIRAASLVPTEHRETVLPVYVGHKGDPFGRTDYIRELLKSHATAAHAMLEQALGYASYRCLHRVRYDASSFVPLLRGLHAPRTLTEATGAYKAAHALCALDALGEAYDGLQRLNTPRPWDIGSTEIESYQERLPFALTCGQREAAQEWLHDLRTGVAGSRLLSGDVGSGKTYVYLPIMAALLDRGARVSVLSPNRILASQIYQAMRESYPMAPVGLMAGGGKRAAAEQPGLIGTQAVLHHHERAGTLPDVLIVDEQQRLGNAQKLSVVGPETHVVEVTATAIPRTLALAKFSGLRVSRLTQQPVEKQIDTVLFEPDQHQGMFDAICEVVSAGKQAAVIYASKSAGESSAAAATERFEALFPGKVATVHGGQGKRAANKALLSIVNGSAQIIVATTVIEIGVTFEHLHAMAVIGAERFGAATLHQLRGRLARKGGRGIFCLAPSKPLEELREQSRQRLEVILRSNDGEEIAMQDLLSRGMGDLKKLGIRQSGARPALFAGVKLTPRLLEAFLRAYPRSQPNGRHSSRHPATAAGTPRRA